MSERRSLNFEGPDDAIAEARRLRGGWKKTGNWTLPQVCRHLEIAVRFSMKAGPHEAVTPSLKAKMGVAMVLAMGKIPVTVQAPEKAVPPADTPESAIDKFIEAMLVLKTFPGPFAPHPLFGSLEHDKFVRLHLIHAAHHLSFIVPN